MTEVDICNLALDNLGITDKIMSLGDSTKEGKACGRWYANTRDLVLRSFPWSFAARIAALTPTSTQEHPLWGALYEVPSDFLKARRLVRAGERTTLKPPPFDVITKTGYDGFLIGTDEEGLYLSYTAQFDTDDRIRVAPATFIDALSWKLASRLVLPLALKDEYAERSEKIYKQAAFEAFAVESDQQQSDPQPESEFITVRG